MGVMKSLFSGKQMSEAFICSAFLALSGGFQDAYTYNTRNEVFSNAQTGNVVLMSQNFMTGKWEAGLKYLFPLFAFALGVLIAEQIQHKYKYAKRLHWRQGILGAEIIILFIVGFIPQLQGVDNDSICSWNYSYGMSGCRTSGRPVCNSFRYSEDEPQT